MGLEAIGLEAILKDENFQQGLERYHKGIDQMTGETDHAAGVLSGMGQVLSGALAVGLGIFVAGAGAAIAVSKLGVDATMEWSENLDRLGDEFGLSGQQATVWTVAMNHVGLSLDEGAQGLNYFTRQLDNYKQGSAGSTTATAKNAEQIAHLRQQLDDANVRLQRAQKTLAEAKKPTDAMRYAVEDAQKAVGRLNTELGQAQKVVPAAAAKLTPFEQALKTLGVSAYDSKGKLKTFDQIMPEIMDHFQKLPSGVNASALAMDLFGARGGSKFLDFLRQGSAGLKNAKELAEEFGLNLSTAQVDAAEQYGFALNDLGLGLTGIQKQFGDALLPVFKDGVVYLNQHVIPVFVDLAKKYAPILADGMQKVFFVVEDLFDIFQHKSTGLGDFENDLIDLANFFKLDGLAIGKFVEGAVNAFQRLWASFQKGGARGLFDQLVKEIQTAAPAILGELGQLGSRLWDWLTKDAGPKGAAEVGKLAGELGGWLKANWPTISAQLGVWGTQFWDWLTGKGGVIAQIGTRMAPFVNALHDWLADPKNTQPVRDALATWVGWFWEWLTDSKNGLLISVSGQMVKLSEAIKAWSEAPETKKQLGEIGKSIGQSIFDGIGSLFSDGKQGDNVWKMLLRNLDTARRNNLDALKNIVSAMASDFWTWVFSAFTDPVQAQNWGNAIGNAFANAIDYVIQGIPNLIAKLVEAWNNLIAGAGFKFPWDQQPPAPTTPPGGTGLGTAGASYAIGGWVTQTMPALVHRGEYVIPARPVASSVGRGGPIQIINNWPDTVAQMDRSALEQLFETAAYKAIKVVLTEGAA